MRSSSGEHFVALDHVRALAAFMVFSWHFMHALNGYPVPFEYVPKVFFLSLLDEGHTGVALFMTLSGYLFAKLLEGKKINYAAFIWNRFLRLAPLLAVVIVIVGIREVVSGMSLADYLYSIAEGIVLPTLPNGGWSVTIEAQYYVALPLLLFLIRKSKFSLVWAILGAIALRYLVLLYHGEVQSLAFWTIVGRIDQFLLGMLAFHFRALARDRHWVVSGVLIAFSLFYWYFDFLGGFYFNPSYPSPSAIWVVLPTIEGMAYGFGIAYYDSTFSPPRNGVSGFLALIGAYSYSIYLLHFFFVFHAARFVNDHIMWIVDFYRACAWSFICFILMVPIGFVSFAFVESPFLKLRKQYTTPLVVSANPSASTEGRAA